ncbi:MAG: hypothetical protein Q8L48_22415 [Archangium sp.]|nr:hypothetical protein [Archangium sp.]
MRAARLKRLLVCVVALTACGPKKPTPPPRTLPEAGDLMAHVSEPGGAPVASAIFDGVAAFTDRNGVATGTLAPNAAGWTRLQAPGHATTWTRPLPVALRGKKILLAKLTPLQLLAEVDPLAEQTLVVGNVKQPDAELRVPLLGFMLPVTVAFATIRPQDLGPMAFAPQTGATALKLQRAFSIEATNREDVMQPTNPIELRLRHPDRFGPPTLGTFDPAQGRWVMDAAACSRVEPQWVRCTFTHFSMQGLFGGAGPDSTGDGWGDTSSNLWDPGSTAPIEDVANAARDFASRHPDESGKSALMAAAARATAAGRNDIVTDLVDRGRTMVEDLIDIELNEEGCGHVSEMFHLAEQGILLAVNPAQLKQLDDKIQEALNGCDVWVGWIHYYYLVQASMPELEDNVLVEGSRDWREDHVVRISRDDKGNFHGESTADVKFPNVVYRDDADNDPPCDDFVDLEAEGNPSTGRVRVLFEGVVADEQWTVTKVSSEPLAPLALRTRYHTRMWSMPDDVCVEELNIDNWLTWTDAYTTQLHQGFLGPSAPSLAEMLTEGHRSVNPLGRGEQGISGFKTVPVEAQPGVWPFTRMHVAWHFFQVTPPQ